MTQPIEPPRREWIPLPPAPGGRLPTEEDADEINCVWGMDLNGKVIPIHFSCYHEQSSGPTEIVDIMSVWHPKTAKPAPYVPPPETETSWIAALTDDQLQELSRHPRLQDICHNLPPVCREEFERGCRESADMLFGPRCDAAVEEIRKAVEHANEPEKRIEGWANVYENGVIGAIHDTQESADRWVGGRRTRVAYLREVLPGDIDPDAAKELVDFIVGMQPSAWPDKLLELTEKRRAAMTTEKVKRPTDDS